MLSDRDEFWRRGPGEDDIDQGKSCAKADRSRDAPARRRRFGNAGNFAPADRGDFSIPSGMLVEDKGGPERGAEDSELSFSEVKEALR